jgi:hypothetical protein
LFRISLDIVRLIVARLLVELMPCKISFDEQLGFCLIKSNIKLSTFIKTLFGS